MTRHSRSQSIGPVGNHPVLKSSILKHSLLSSSELWKQSVDLTGHAMHASAVWRRSGVITSLSEKSYDFAASCLVDPYADPLFNCLVLVSHGVCLPFPADTRRYLQTQLSLPIDEFNGNSIARSPSEYYHRVYYSIWTQ